MAVMMKDDEPHDVRQFQAEDGRGWWRTDCPVENTGWRS